MAQCTLSGTVKDISDTAISGAVITAKIISPVFSGTTHVLPTEITTTSDANGAWGLSVLQGASLSVSIQYPPNSTNSRQPLSYSAIIPAAASADFSTIAVS